MKMKVGLSMFSLMRELSEDYMGTLENIAKAGYKYIEFITPPAHHGENNFPSPEEIAAKVKELGLVPISSHCGFTADDDLEKIADDQVRLGTPALVLPMSVMPDLDTVRNIAALCNRMGKLCKDRGIDFYYHNHAQEFLMIDGKPALYWLAELTDPELVSFQLDTYWAARGGYCPIEVMKTLGSRCRMLHQKDMGESADPVNLMEGVTELDPANFRQTIFAKQHPTDIVTVGTGKMDIPAILQTADELGHAHAVIVELDCVCRFNESEYDTPLSPLASVRASREYLENLIG